MKRTHATTTANNPRKAHYPKFFAMLRKAQENLGLVTAQEREAYYRFVLMSEAKVSSIKDIESERDFDALFQRVALDAGDFSAAVREELEANRRKAFVIKVMTRQILQLSGVPEAVAVEYFEAILWRCGMARNFHVIRGDFSPDFTARELQTLIQILDSHLRRLKKKIVPGEPLTFNPRVRYSKTGEVAPVEAGFYTAKSGHEFAFARA